MSEMRERLARNMRFVMYGVPPQRPLDDDSVWLKLAKVAIEDMREPTAEQGMAMYLAWDAFGENASMGPEEAIAIYRAAIDEALK